MTLKELFDYWFHNYAKIHIKSADAFRRYFELYLQPLAGRDLSAIKKFDVLALQAKLKEERSESAANKAVELISMLYSRAQEWELFEGRNPAWKLRKFKSHSRNRFLQPEEIARFLQAVNACKNVRVRDFLKMLLWTGQRRSNVADMRWDQIDLARKIWNIPMTKNGEPHTVPLTAEAIAVLELRKGGHPEFVFPLLDGSRGMYHMESQWREVRRVAGLDDLTMHDLRRTHASWQVITGANLPVVGATLGHKSSKSTEIYARLNLDPVRSAMGTATAAMVAQPLDVSIKEINERARVPGGRMIRYGTRKKSNQLTEIETKVLHLLGDGLSYRQIGERLGRVQGSVAEATRSIAGKLGIETVSGKLSLRTAVVRRAMELGVLVDVSAK